VKLNTFYQIYYSHRVKKANFLKKIFISILLPINYVVNKILYPKQINLDLYKETNKKLFSRNLGSLFEKFNSDKGKYFINQYQKPIHQNDRYIRGHEYHNYYEKFFKEKKDKKINILELGTFKGNATAAFYFYFKNARFFSGDLYPDLFCYKSKRIKNFLIDTNSEKEITRKIIKKQISYDIIIEDAGHYLKDQIISLFMVFRKLNSKGIFVIEELDFPDTRKDMNLANERPTLKDILLKVKKKKNFFSKYISKKDKEYFLVNVNKINIYKGRFNEIAFITKK